MKLMCLTADYYWNQHLCPSEMKFIFLTLLLVSGVTDSRSEQFKVLGPADPVFAEAGKDVILPCSVKPNISVVDMRVEWFRLDQKDSPVHLYEDHEDRNREQIQSYRKRTKLIHQELQRGNASLQLSTVRASDEGRYKCLIQSKSWYDDAALDVIVEAVGSPPVITVDGFDGSGGLHLQCESEGWNPEPDLEWLDSEGVCLSSETTDTHRNSDGFSVKHTVIVYDRDSKIHCRVKMRHHMLETVIITSNQMFNFWRTSVILISVIVVLIVIAGILITVFAHKKREHDQLSRSHEQLSRSHGQLKQSHLKLFRSQKMIITQAVTHFRKHLDSHQFNLDLNTVNKNLRLSENKRVITCTKTQQQYPDHPDRFDVRCQVLCGESVCEHCYWEIEWSGRVDVSVSNKSISRKGWGDECVFGNNDQSWSLNCSSSSYSFWHNNRNTDLAVESISDRIGVYVDLRAGTLSFFSISDTVSLIHTVQTIFTLPLYPGFRVDSGSSVKLC